GDCRPLVLFANSWATRDAYQRAVSGSTNVGPGTAGETIGYGAPNPTTGYCAPTGPAKNSLKKESGTTGWTQTQPDGAGFKYDSGGVLRTVRNPAGARMTLNYVSGKVSSVTAPSGRRVTFIRDVAGGNLRAFRDPAGRRTSLTSFPEGFLASVRSPDGAVTTVTRSGIQPYPVKVIINPSGERTSFGYQPGAFPSPPLRYVLDPQGGRTTYAGTGSVR